MTSEEKLKADELRSLNAPEEKVVKKNGKPEDPIKIDVEQNFEFFLNRGKNIKQCFTTIEFEGDKKRIEINDGIFRSSLLEYEEGRRNRFIKKLEKEGFTVRERSGDKSLNVESILFHPDFSVAGKSKLNSTINFNVGGSDTMIVAVKDGIVRTTLEPLVKYLTDKGWFKI